MHPGNPKVDHEGKWEPLRHQVGRYLEVFLDFLVYNIVFTYQKKARAIHCRIFKKQGTSSLGIGTHNFLPNLYIIIENYEVLVVCLF